MIILLLLSGLVLIVLQMFLPEIQVLHARPYLLPILVSYAALRFDLVKGLGAAVGLGLLLDLFSSGRLGGSSISFSLMSLFIYSQSENFNFRGLWQGTFLTLLAVFLYLIVDYLFFCMQIETWRWPKVVWESMVSQAVTDGLLSPLFFWLLDSAQRWLPPGEKLA